MITPQEARQRTRTLVEHYVNECECRDLTDVKHVLTALISMATQAIVATNGKEAALQVLMNTLTTRQSMRCRTGWKPLQKAACTSPSAGSTEGAA